MKRRFIATSLVVTGLFVSISANATLFGVLPATPMGTDWLAYYDDQLDITWAADTAINGILDSWENQVAWAAGLTIGSVSGWRLPSANVNGDGTLVDCFGGGVTGCADNEIGFLFWEEGITPSTPGPFSNFKNSQYWYGTEASATGAWNFRFTDGNQFTLAKGFELWGWAVRDGNASVIPVPAAVWLFGSALGLLGWLKRKTA